MSSQVLETHLQLRTALRIKPRPHSAPACTPQTPALRRPPQTLCSPREPPRGSLMPPHSPSSSLSSWAVLWPQGLCTSCLYHSCPRSWSGWSLLALQVSARGAPLATPSALCSAWRPLEGLLAEGFSICTHPHGSRHRLCYSLPSPQGLAQGSLNIGRINR